MNLRYFLPCLLPLAGLQPALANVTYTYTGNAFNTFTPGSYQPYTSAEHLVFSFTTLNALAANTTIGSTAAPQTAINAPVPELLSWRFSDGFTTVTSATQASLQFFDISTDAGGNINWWNIALEPVNAANGYTMGELVWPWTTSINTRVSVQDYVYHSQNAGAGPSAFAGSSVHGTWLKSVDAVVPLPGADWLFAPVLGAWLLNSRGRAA